MSAIPSVWIWLGIVVCVAQTGLFAGLNLAIFSLSQLRLQLEADGGNSDAASVLELRKDSNYVLSAVIWGNVSTNVFLTLLSDTVLTGIAAFFFSTIAITLLGEIVPQAYFSRNALRMTALFLPFLNFYRIVLYPVAKPTALLLDWWLGKEGITYLAERDIRSLIIRSASAGGDIGRMEALGARNFLDLDDVPVTEEGEIVDAQSVISLPLANQRCVLPPFERTPRDPFLQRVYASGKKWVIVTDAANGEPAFVLDSHQFLRDALFDEMDSDPNTYWHRPIVIRDLKAKIGDVIGQLKVKPERADDDVVDNDMILVWCAQRRIITGADLLGRLLRDIVTVDGKTVGAEVVKV